MSSNIRWGQLTRLDYLGLGRRVGHVRLCGDFLVNLLNWSRCPASNWRPPPDVEARGEAAVQAEVHARISADPAFEQYKAAAAQVLKAGMRLVLNPMHKK